MNAKVEQSANLSSADIGKLLLAAALVVGGFFGFYYFSGQWMSALRGLLLLASILLAVAVMWTTRPGRNFRAYVGESQFELRKVVWPTRDETLRTTAVIVVVVIIISIVLGIIDLILKWVVMDWLLKLGN